MANINKMSQIKSGDAVLQEVFSNNFSRIEIAINSNAVDGNNYSDSSIESGKIATGNILSQHLSNSGLASADISAGAVVNAKVNYATASNGILAMRVDSQLPAIARITGTAALTTTSAQITVNWSSAIDGDPVFVAAPEIGTPLFSFSDSASNGLERVRITAIDSDSAQMNIGFHDNYSDGFTCTYYVVAKGSTQ
jgi:hypothetical protein